MSQTQAQKPQLPAVVGDRNTLQRLLANERFQDQLRGIAGKFLTPEKVTKLAILAMSRQPLLAKCTQPSLLMALMKAAELGLDFAGSTGQGWLIPFKNGRTGQYEVEFWPGVRGYIELAYRSGHVSYIDSQVVRQKDEFRYGLGTSPFVDHTPQIAGDAGPVVCVYAVVLLRNSDIPKVELMTFAEIEAIRQRSRAKDNGPWVSDWNEMAKKTVLKRILKDVPLGPRLEDALALDDSDNAGQDEQQPQHQHVDATVLPEGVDPETGEILGDADQQFLNAAEAEEQPIQPASTDADLPGTGAPPSDFKAKKQAIIDGIYKVVGDRYPADNVASQAARLKLLGHVFGSADPNKLYIMPMEILTAGLDHLKSAQQETQA